MPETYQVTSALKYLSFGKHVTLLTDGRFSGVSTGACIGHISPEAWAGGSLGKLRDGDFVSIAVNPTRNEGHIDYLGSDDLAARELNCLLERHPDTPDDTRLWAALQNASGGSWGGCVYDTDSILDALGEPR